MAQSTFRAFYNFADAKKKLRGRTLSSFLFIGESLHIGEQICFVATASVHMMLRWCDGVVVITDKRVFVGACSEHGSIRQWNVARGPHNVVQQLQGASHLATFQIQTMRSVQGIMLMPDAFRVLADYLETAAPEPRRSGDVLPGNPLIPVAVPPAALAAFPAPPAYSPPPPVSPESPPSGNPIELIEGLQRLFLAGVLSQSEFEQKKSELLLRI